MTLAATVGWCRGWWCRVAGLGCRVAGDRLAWNWIDRRWAREQKVARTRHRWRWGRIGGVGPGEEEKLFFEFSSRVSSDLRSWATYWSWSWCWCVWRSGSRCIWSGSIRRTKVVVVSHLRRGKANERGDDCEELHVSRFLLLSTRVRESNWISTDKNFWFYWKSQIQSAFRGWGTFSGQHISCNTNNPGTCVNHSPIRWPSELKKNVSHYGRRRKELSHLSVLLIWCRISSY